VLVPGKPGNASRFDSPDWQRLGSPLPICHPSRRHLGGYPAVWAGPNSQFLRSSMESWKRNLYVIWAAELVAIAGFSVVFPFLPYYVQELGVTELHEVELWSGALFASQAVTMAVFAPIWGSLADRYGRKLMVQRAMFGGAVILAAMGFVQNVQQLVILRGIQGMLTGTVPAATTLVASSAPRERSGYALGLLQMAVWAGASLGPLLGGFVADAWGYRAAFLVTGALLFLAGITVWRFVTEDFRAPKREKGGAGSGLWYGLRLVIESRALVSLFSIRVCVRTATRLLGPTLPLFIQSLAPGTVRIASLTGLISGVSAATSAVGAVTLGRASDRLGYRRVLLACAAGVGLLYVPQYFVTTPWQLLALQGALGLVMSGVLASISALLANLAPEGREGAVFGVDTSVVAAANAVGPMLGAGAAAAWGLRAPFLIAAGGLAVATGLGWLLVPSTRLKPGPAASDQRAGPGR
jgi:DHA1 family multidrug resistance protein-like MFS transporter